MYMIVGYNLMYPSDGTGVSAVSFFLGGDNAVEDVVAGGGDIYYSGLSISSSGGFCCNCNVNRFWCCC